MAGKGRRQSARTALGRMEIHAIHVRRLGRFGDAGDDKWCCWLDQRLAHVGCTVRWPATDLISLRPFTSALRVPQAGPSIGPAPAFAVQAAVTFGGAFFRGAALVLDLDAAFGLGLRAGGSGGSGGTGRAVRTMGLFAFGAAGCAANPQQGQSQAGTQQSSAQATGTSARMDRRKGASRQERAKLNVLHGGGLGGGGGEGNGARVKQGVKEGWAGLQSVQQ